MPGANEYILDQSSPEYDALEKAFNDEISTRGKVIDQAWEYYRGDQKRPLASQGDGIDDNVIVNQIKPLVEKCVSLLLGSGPTFDASPETESDTDAATDPLDAEISAAWRRSRGAILLNNIARSGALEGHCAVRVKAGVDGPLVERVRQRHFAAFWDPLELDVVRWYRLQYVSGNMGRRIDYVAGTLLNGGPQIDQEGDGWTEYVYDYLGDDTPSPVGTPTGRWKLLQQQQWEYDWCPIVDWQNAPDPENYYGFADISDALDLNNAINFILSNMTRIVKIWADPKTVVTGANVSDIIPTAVGGLFSIPNPEAKVYNLEMQSDLKSSQSLFEIILRALWNSAGMVDPSTLKDKVGALTNFGLRVLFLDALTRTENKRSLYNEGFEGINKRILSLANKEVPEEIATNWPEMLPYDDAEKATVLLQELGADVLDLQTYREMRGYDNTEIEERLAQQKAGGQTLAEQLLTNFERGTFNA